MGAVMMMGAGAGVDLPMLVHLLPHVESAILAGSDGDAAGDDDDPDEGGADGNS